MKSGGRCQYILKLKALSISQNRVCCLENRLTVPKVQIIGPISQTVQSSPRTDLFPWGGGGGGGFSESMDGQGCAILALEVVPKNLILA